MLARVDRMHREFFKPASSPTTLAWEPPADVLETDEEVLVLVALPGVDAERAEIAVDDGHLIITGLRILPPALRSAIIHRLELPQGRFHRRLPLPPGRYSGLSRAVIDGCLVISLQKAGYSRG